MIQLLKQILLAYLFTHQDVVSQLSFTKFTMLIQIFVHVKLLMQRKKKEKVQQKPTEIRFNFGLKRKITGKDD